MNRSAEKHAGRCRDPESVGTFPRRVVRGSVPDSAGCCGRLAGAGLAESGTGPVTISGDGVTVRHRFPQPRGGRRRVVVRRSGPPLPGAASLRACGGASPRSLPAVVRCGFWRAAGWSAREIWLRRLRNPSVARRGRRGLLRLPAPCRLFSPLPVRHVCAGGPPYALSTDGRCRRRH